MTRRTLMMELVVAGALAGLLIGDNSLKDFIGLDVYNTVPFNMIGGAVLGMLTGVLLSFLPQSE